jgi:hypothetical protein
MLVNCFTCQNLSDIVAEFTTSGTSGRHLGRAAGCASACYCVLEASTLSFQSDHP